MPVDTYNGQRQTHAQIHQAHRHIILSDPGHWTISTHIKAGDCFGVVLVDAQDATRLQQGGGQGHITRVHCRVETVETVLYCGRLF